VAKAVVLLFHSVIDSDEHRKKAREREEEEEEEEEGGALAIVLVIYQNQGTTAKNRSRTRFALQEMPGINVTKFQSDWCFAHRPIPILILSRKLGSSQQRSKHASAARIGIW
jgi:hypothetical protein